MNVDRLNRLPGAVAALATVCGSGLWLAALLSDREGLGLGAMWCFVVVAVAIAWALPIPAAVVSPLFAGLLGWLVDMLPLVMLAGWASVTIRWVILLWRERRLPLGGRFIWIPIGLTAWTALGGLVVPRYDFKHFLLLFGIQGLIASAWLIGPDLFRDIEARFSVIAGLALFAILMTAGVSLEWAGAPVQELQFGVSEIAEEAYGVDAFPTPSDIGMIKYVRSAKPGDEELRKKLRNLRSRNEGMPRPIVFLPKFHAFRNQLLVRFVGDARPYEEILRKADVTLLYDNLGVAPARAIPRMRSFARNALTYAGMSAALLPLAFGLAWITIGRRRWIGRVAVACCLFGVAMSVARGAWAAIAIGVLYLLIDGALDAAKKRAVLAAIVAAAMFLTGFFYLRYEVDPLFGRAGGDASFATRQNLYEETLLANRGIHILVGYGTERPRAAVPGARADIAGRRYVPPAGTHSTLLNYLFRAGFPGALALLFLYALAWMQSRATAWAERARERTLATALAMSVVILGAHALILSLYVEPIYSLTISIVVGLALATGAGASHPIWPPRWRPTRA